MNGRPEISVVTLRETQSNGIEFWVVLGVWLGWGSWLGALLISAPSARGIARVLKVWCYGKSSAGPPDGVLEPRPLRVVMVTCTTHLHAL